MGSLIFRRSPCMIRIVGDLLDAWRRLDERIEHVTTEIEAVVRSNEGCRQLMTVPGIGPIGARWCTVRCLACLGGYPCQCASYAASQPPVPRRSQALAAHEVLSVQQVLRPVPTVPGVSLAPSCSGLRRVLRGQRLQRRRWPALCL